MADAKIADDHADEAEAVPADDVEVADPEMEVVKERIATLVLDDQNARRGDVSSIAQSLTEFGQHRAVVVQKDTRKVIIGNHMVQAAATLGWEHLWVQWVDDDDDEAQRRSLADNLIADRSKWKNDQLTAILVKMDEPLTIPGADNKIEKLLTQGGQSSIEQPMLPILPQPGEHYSFVMVVSNNVVDDSWLQTFFKLKKVQSYKNSAVGLARAVTVAEFRNIIGAPSPAVEPEADAEPEGDE